MPRLYSEIGRLRKIKELIAFIEDKENFNSREMLDFLYDEKRYSENALEGKTEKEEPKTESNNPKKTFVKCYEVGTGNEKHLYLNRKTINFLRYLQDNCPNLDDWNFVEVDDFEVVDFT